MNNRFSYPALSVVLLTMCLAASLAHAHGDDDERHQKHDRQQHSQDERDRHAYILKNPKLKAECGSCHVVYPPKMLPAASWHEIMQHLDKHFGTDASVDAATQSELGELFHNEAASRDETRSGKPVLRITETRWFRDEHHEISPRAWRNPKVKNASNCGACHTKADEGRFGEHEVRIPR